MDGLAEKLALQVPECGLQAVEHDRAEAQPCLNRLREVMMKAKLLPMTCLNLEREGVERGRGIVKLPKE